MQAGICIRRVGRQKYSLQILIPVYRHLESDNFNVRTPLSTEQTSHPATTTENSLKKFSWLRRMTTIIPSMIRLLGTTAMQLLLFARIDVPFQLIPSIDSGSFCVVHSVDWDLAHQPLQILAHGAFAALVYQDHFNNNPIKLVFVDVMKNRAFPSPQYVHFVFSWTVIHQMQSLCSYTKFTNEECWQQARGWAQSGAPTTHGAPLETHDSVSKASQSPRVAKACATSEKGCARGTWYPRSQSWSRRPQTQRKIRLRF